MPSQVEATNRVTLPLATPAQLPPYVACWLVFSLLRCIAHRDANVNNRKGNTPEARKGQEGGSTSAGSARIERNRGPRPRWIPQDAFDRIPGISGWMEKGGHPVRFNADLVTSRDCHIQFLALNVPSILLLRSGFYSAEVFSVPATAKFQRLIVRASLP